jgi:hypothetical protein
VHITGRDRCPNVRSTWTDWPLMPGADVWKTTGRQMHHIPLYPQYLLVACVQSIWVVDLHVEGAMMKYSKTRILFDACALIILSGTAACNDASQTSTPQSTETPSTAATQDEANAIDRDGDLTYLSRSAVYDKYARGDVFCYDPQSQDNSCKTIEYADNITPESMVIVSFYLYSDVEKHVMRVRSQFKGKYSCSVSDDWAVNHSSTYMTFNSLQSRRRGYLDERGQRRPMAPRPAGPLGKRLGCRTLLSLRMAQRRRKADTRTVPGGQVHRGRQAAGGSSGHGRHLRPQGPVQAQIETAALKRRGGAGHPSPLSKPPVFR